MSILFLSDWQKYPNATIHYETKNTSFLRLAEIYYKMGIKNNAFPLALLQPELKDVDPFDEGLPFDIKAKILYECKNNYWFVFREIIRVPTPGATEASRFRADRANIALYWLFFNHIMTLLVIIRQTGKTTSLMALVTALLNFWTINTFINLLTKSESLKVETLAKLKALFEELPPYLNFSSKKDIFNSDEVRLKDLDNIFKGNLSSSSPKQAEKVGRGFTSPINIIDECAYVENVSIAMGAMLMSGNAAREFARQNNKPYGTILATTAGDIDDRDGRYIFNLLNSSTVWDEKFLDCKDEADLTETIFKNSIASTNASKRPLVSISFSYRQLGYDDEWLKRKLEENISTPENIARDIFNEWLSGSRASPIPKELLDILKSSRKSAEETEFYAPYNYKLNWYIDKSELNAIFLQGGFLSIGIDTSDAVGRDDIAFIARESLSGSVVCSATFNEVNLITVADFFASFLLRYENSIMVIERRSSAATIIDYLIQKLLLNDINPYTRLYNTIVQDKNDKYQDAYEEVRLARSYQEQTFIKYKKHIGFTTSAVGATSRNELYSSTLINMLKYTAHCTFDSKLIDQISALEIRNNRIDHPEGGNDDLVIASLLSYWLLINGKNLNSYGVDATKILKQNRVYLENKYSTADQDSDTLFELEQELNLLLQQYKQEKNPYIAKQLEVKIKQIISELNNNSAAITAQELLEQIEQQRRFRRF